MRGSVGRKTSDGLQLLLTTMMVMKMFIIIIMPLMMMKIMIVIEKTMMLLMIVIKMEMRIMAMTMMMITITVVMMVLAGFLSCVHIFTLAQMERGRWRGQTPVARGTLAPQLATTRVRTPATAGRTKLQ